MPLSDFKSKYSIKELRFNSKSKRLDLMKKYYPSVRHDPHESFLYGFLGLIYDGINTVEELKKQMRLFFISSTRQLVVEDQDVEEYLQYARTKKLIILKSDGKINLTPDGKELAEVSYFSTLHASYWMSIIFNKKTIILSTVISLIFLSLLKILIGLQLSSQGMINEGIENLTDLIKIGIVSYIGFKLKKDKLASIIIIGVMMVTGIMLIISGIKTLLNPTPIVPTIQAYLICLFSIIINLALMFLKSLVGRTSGNLSLMSDSKDSSLNVKISASVAVGLTFAIFKIYFIDALIGIIIAILVFKEGIEILRELFVREEDFDITAIKVIADNIYDNRLTGYILGSIRRDSNMTKEILLNNFEKGLEMGRYYYGGFADFFYTDLGPPIAEKHLNKLIIDKVIDKIDKNLTLTSKGLRLFYKAKSKEYNERAQSVHLGRPKIRKGVIFFMAFVVFLILLIFYANQINQWLYNQ